MNPKKIKLATIIGTRPEIIRLSRIIPKLDKFFEHTLIHTGQNYDYELNEVFFEDLKIRKPDLFLECASSSSAKTIAKVIESSDDFFRENLQDAVLILGDTNSSLSAISAKRRKIPIFHMEAGNRSYDERVPEEINRRIVDHISDINLPYTSIARDYLISEGINPDFVIRTGSPLDEVLQFYHDRIEASEILSILNLEPSKYFVVSSHREENIDTSNFLKLSKILNNLAEVYGLTILFSTHPRTEKIIAQNEINFHEKIVFHKPFSFSDYIQLQRNAKAVLSDSGSITEESSLLNFPAINIRDAHERPEGFEEGAVMMTGLNQDRVFVALKILEDQESGLSRTIYPVRDYSAPNLSEKIVRIILSYTDYVNSNVWKKSEDL